MSTGGCGTGFAYRHPRRTRASIRIIIPNDLCHASSSSLRRPFGRPWPRSEYQLCNDQDDDAPVEELRDRAIGRGRIFAATSGGTLGFGGPQHTYAGRRTQVTPGAVGKSPASQARASAAGFRLYRIAACAPRRAEPPARVRDGRPRGGRRLARGGFRSTPTRASSACSCGAPASCPLRSCARRHLRRRDRAGLVWCDADLSGSRYACRSTHSWWTIRRRAAAGAEFPRRCPRTRAAAHVATCLVPPCSMPRATRRSSSAPRPLSQDTPSKLLVRIVVRGARSSARSGRRPHRRGFGVGVGLHRSCRASSASEPFSAVGGAIAVADEVEIRFDLVANAIGGRADGSPPTGRYPYRSARAALVVRLHQQERCSFGSVEDRALARIEAARQP